VLVRRKAISASSAAHLKLITVPDGNDVQAFIECLVTYYQSAHIQQLIQRSFNMQIHSDALQSIQKYNNGSIPTPEEIPFNELDGSLGSFTTALDVLRSLLSTQSGVVFYVIDGLQLVARTSGVRPDIQQLLATFRPFRENKSEHLATLKLLFTTDGFTDVLKHLGPKERLDVSQLTHSTEVGYGPGLREMAFLKIRTDDEQ
jgi:hypothetical protein